MLLGKIHRATVTGADLNYEGSITIDETLMEAAGILVYEKVHILNIATGIRAETYVIRGKRDSGEIIMNGAIARIVQVGDPVIILSYGYMEEEKAKILKPRHVFVNESNRIVHVQSQEAE
jgi:aspartate 1-decarboxylase